MAYIIFNDFKKIIQSDNLLQVIGSDLSLISGVTLTAQDEAISYLIQKYKVSAEFTDTVQFNTATIYGGGNRVYLDALSYDVGTSYNIGDLTLISGSVYICIGATTGTFDITRWALLGNQYTIFFITYPFPLFNYLSTYIKGYQVFWNGKTYTCKIATIQPTHEGQLQGGTYSNQPLPNILPDDPASGIEYWGIGVAYAVAAGTLPTDTTKWTSGDNRSSQLVQYCCDIALYHIHSRIAPRNIPELRVKRRDEAIEWLKMAGQGKITANIPLLQPKSGGRILFGGSVKQINQY